MMGDLLKIILAFLSFLILDFMWINFISKKFYFKEFRQHVEIKRGKIKVKKIAAILIYFILSFGIIMFIKGDNIILFKIIKGALFGFIVYSVYDLTNYSIMKNYSLRLTIVDIIWGTFLCGMVSVIISFIP